MSKSAGGTASSLRFHHTIVSELEGDAVYLNVDEQYVYAACTDLKVRVWSRSDWQLVAELGETSSPPLAVHVDENQVYATCEKRVYVWNKNTWGMIGWFELSYTAATSTLRGDSLYVGAKEGRLVSIKKDSHDTSSWQLFKADIVSIWGDGEIICTSTSKDEPIIWKLESEGAPTELKRLDKKDKGALLVGNTNFIITGVTTASIKLWNRVDWSLDKTLNQAGNGSISSLWANDLYLIASSNTSIVSVWDINKGVLLGSAKIAGTKIHHVRAYGQYIFLATPNKILVLSMLWGQQALDFFSEDSVGFGTRILRTSPYDVLEGVLELQKRGDTLIRESKFHEAVAEYEQALQILIDNTHALLEVPNEREKLTNELSDRLGHSLLRAKISEIQDLTKVIKGISEEFDESGRSTKDEEELERIWVETIRAIKESRVLTEAQAGHILSYQLTHATDVLEAEWKEAKRKYDEYQEKINDARTLSQKISSEWRWLERKRSSLDERAEFLSGAIETLQQAVSDAQGDEEVIEILSSSLNEFISLNDQINRILSIAKEEPEEITLTKAEASEAIKGLLSVLAKRKKELSAIQDSREKERETLLLINATEQALDAAKQFKMKRRIETLSKELDLLKGKKPDSGEPKTVQKRQPKETPKKKPRKKTRPKKKT